jgi:hypothetical protein
MGDTHSNSFLLASPTTIGMSERAFRTLLAGLGLLGSSVAVYQLYGPTVPALHRQAHRWDWPWLGWVRVQYKTQEKGRIVDGYQCDQCDVISRGGRDLIPPADGLLSNRLDVKQAEDVLSRRLWQRTPLIADRGNQIERVMQLRLKGSPHRVQLEHMLLQEGYQGWKADNYKEERHDVGDPMPSLTRWMM